MRINWKEILAVVVLLAVVAYGIRAFMIPGLYTSHDGETHTARLANYYLALQEGQYPPALAPTLFGGFGFPIFIFIYPLPYFLGAIAHFVGFSYTDSTELVMALGQLGSAFFFYLFLKTETKNTWASLVGAMFFAWAPYRYSMLFVRGAFAESFSYLFVAASFYSLAKLTEEKNWRWSGWSSISLAGMLLSHQLSSVMFLPALVFYLFTKFLSKQKLPIFKVLLSFVVAGLMAGFIYLPSFFERKYLQFDQLISYSLDHFVTFKQLLHSPWSYGFSHPGTVNDDMSFQIGLAHLMVLGLAGLAFLAYLVKEKKLSKLPKEMWLMVVWFIPLIAAVFFMLELPVNYYLWKHLPGLNYLDFPWRLLGVTTLASAMIVAYLVSSLKKLWPLAVLLILAVLIANRNHLRINEPVILSDSYFENYPATATWRNEFLPKSRMTNKWEGIHDDYQVISGKIDIVPIKVQTDTVELDLNVVEEGELLIHRLNFPGWQFYLEGVKQPHESETFNTFSAIDLKTNTDYTGFIKSKLIPGRYRVLVKYEPTPLRQTGLMMSVIGLLISLFLVTAPDRLSFTWPKAHGKKS